MMWISDALAALVAEPRSRRTAAALFFALLILPAITAQAHDVWIGVPSAVEPNQLVSVRLFQGHGGASEPLARNDRRLKRLFSIDPNAEQAEVPGLHGSDPAGLLRPNRPGTWTVIYQSETASHVTSAEVFNRHLKLEGLHEIVDMRRRSGQLESKGNELYSRTLRALIPVGDEPVQDRPSGLDVELVLESVADQVVIRLLTAGEPVVGTLVDFHPLFPATDGPSMARRSDAEGRVRFPRTDTVAANPESESWVATAVLTRALSTEVGSGGVGPEDEGSEDEGSEDEGSEDKGSEDKGSEQAEWRTWFVALTFPMASTDPSR